MLSLSPCNLCPRRCGADRTKHRGMCGASDRLRAAKAMIHEGEEPCLIGRAKDYSSELCSELCSEQNSKRRYGAGAVFFSGCNLKCVFCQNAPISLNNQGWPITTKDLARIFLSLQNQGAACLDLVTPTPYVLQIKEALEAVKDRLQIPVVYNCGGYESTEALSCLDGLVDIYMPDMKYCSSELSKEYSGAADYFDVAKTALEEMVRQCPEPIFSKDGQMIKGVLVRHLVLPGAFHDSEALMDYLSERYQGRIRISLLRQYTPPSKQEVPDFSKKYPKIDRKITSFEYERVVERALSGGLEGYRQGKGSAGMQLRPVFDGSGLGR